MKKISLILLALVLCISVLSIPALATEDTITVYVSIDSDTAPNAWAWGSYGNAFTEWPGEPMTQDGDLWKIEVPMGTTGFIANDGSAQTADITIDGASDVWITVSADFSSFEISYEAPTTDAPVVDEPVVDEPVVDEPVDDEPVDDEPVDDEPVDDEPVVDEPVEDAPETDAPAEEDTEVDAPAEDEGAEEDSTEVTTAASKKQKETTSNKTTFLGQTMTKKTKTLILLGAALVVVIIIAAILSIPKKIK